VTQFANKIFTRILNCLLVSCVYGGFFYQCALGGFWEVAALGACGAVPPSAIETWKLTSLMHQAKQSLRTGDYSRAVSLARSEIASGEGQDQVKLYNFTEAHRILAMHSPDRAERLTSAVAAAKLFCGHVELASALPTESSRAILYAAEQCALSGNTGESRRLLRWIWQDHRDLFDKYTLATTQIIAANYAMRECDSEDVSLLVDNLRSDKVTATLILNNIYVFGTSWGDILVWDAKARGVKDQSVRLGLLSEAMDDPLVEAGVGLMVVWEDYRRVLRDAERWEELATASFKVAMLMDSKYLSKLEKSVVADANVAMPPLRSDRISSRPWLEAVKKRCLSDSATIFTFLNQSDLARVCLDEFDGAFAPPAEPEEAQHWVLIANRLQAFQGHPVAPSELSALNSLIGKNDDRVEPKPVDPCNGQQAESLVK